MANVEKVVDYCYQTSKLKLSIQDMTKSLKITLFSIVTVITFVSLLLIKFLHGHTALYSNVYEVLVTIMPIVGGVLGILVAKAYGGLKSSFGQGITFVSLYLIVWGIGQSVWAYYNIFGNVSVPYPSLADFGYLLAIPLGLYGVVKLSSAMGAKYAIRSTAGKLTLIVIPLICLIASYYLLIVVGRGGFPDASHLNLKFFVDLAYPTGDVAIVAFALTTIVLARGFLGGRFKMPLYLILLGFVLMYIADFSLSYTSTKNTYYDGCWVDYFYTAGLATIAYGLILLDPAARKKTPVPASVVPSDNLSQQ